MGPFAYYNQNLIVHLENTQKIAIRYADQNYSDISALRIRIASNNMSNMDKCQFQDLLKMASLMHDTGKAADIYQRLFSDPCKPISFYLHEIPSAIIAKKLMDKLNYSPFTEFLVVFTILSHHNSMRPFSRQELELRWRNYSWTFFDHYETIHAFLVDMFGCSVEFKRITNNDLMCFINWIEALAGDPSFKYAKLYILILNALVRGDNLDARSRKSGGHITNYWKRYMAEMEVDAI